MMEYGKEMKVYAYPLLCENTVANEIRQTTATKRIKERSAYMRT
jgi:hypothetical protein